MSNNATQNAKPTNVKPLSVNDLEAQIAALQAKITEANAQKEAAITAAVVARNEKMAGLVKHLGAKDFGEVFSLVGTFHRHGTVAPSRGIGGGGGGGKSPYSEEQNAKAKEMLLSRKFSIAQIVAATGIGEQTLGLRKKGLGIVGPLVMVNPPAVPAAPASVPANV